MSPISVYYFRSPNSDSFLSDLRSSVNFTRDLIANDRPTHEPSHTQIPNFNFNADNRHDVTIFILITCLIAVKIILTPSEKRTGIGLLASRFTAVCQEMKSFYQLLYKKKNRSLEVLKIDKNFQQVSDQNHEDINSPSKRWMYILSRYRITKSEQEGSS